MATGREEVNRLQEEIHRTVSHQLQTLESDLQTFQNLLISSLNQVTKKIALARGENFPDFEKTIEEGIHDAVRSSADGMTFLTHYTYEARLKETQEELLTHLMSGASRFAGKVSLFVARGDRFIGWSARGFTDALIERIRQSSFLQSDSALLRETLEKDSLKSIGDLSGEATVRQIVGSEAIAPWHTLPLRALGRPVAILLASPEVGQTCNLEALCVLTDVTGLCLESLALRVMQEAPPPPRSVSEEPAPAVAPVKEVEEQEIVTSIESVPTQVETEAAAPPVLELDLTVEEAAPPKPVLELPPEQPAPAADEIAEIFPKLFAEPAPPAAEPVFQEPEPVQPPPPPPPVAEPQAKTPSPDEKLHSDAKRFARLLVSEIKLYNEQRVLEGRENRDIYVRLKRDIDRSREMYEKRVSPMVAAKVDYFHDELVRILGDNDRSALGSDYPGARVEN